MTETTTITVRLSLETKEKLDRLAELTQRSRSWLAAEAVDSFVRQELEICEDIARGLDEADAGDTITHEEAMERLDDAIQRASRKST